MSSWVRTRLTRDILRNYGILASECFCIMCLNNKLSGEIQNHLQHIKNIVFEYFVRFPIEIFNESTKSFQTPLDNLKKTAEYFKTCMGNLCQNRKRVIQSVIKKAATVFILKYQEAFCKRGTSFHSWRAQCANLPTLGWCSICIHRLFLKI